ncbi:MAG: RAMP superfamily CRISPR-associated protein, partial [Phycisphaerae bacterium]
MIKYVIELQSDAHIGSGFGGEFVNNYVTRDAQGRAMIRASHIKGLLRQTLTDMLEPLGCMAEVHKLLGSPGWRPALPAGLAQQPGSGFESVFHFNDVVLKHESAAAGQSTRIITRTAISPTTGTILNQSLRSAEAVGAGTRFCGSIGGT